MIAFEFGKTTISARTEKTAAMTSTISAGTEETAAMTFQPTSGRPNLQKLKLSLFSIS